MDAWKKRAVELICSIALTDNKSPSVISSRPRKTGISRPESDDLPRVSPERAGMSATALIRLLSELEENPRANVHNLMILRDGKVVCEASAPGYSVHIPHLAHSMSKTVTGIAVGMLIDEKKLSADTRVVDLFPEFPPKDKRFFTMTVEHLLAMQSGVPFSEAGSVTEEEWTRAFFESSLSFEPGEDYDYNSMNSYILGRIVRRVSGQGLTEFLTPRLFEPLNIHNVFWEIGPEGDEMGGWGLYLSAESWAKIGHMMLRDGEFNGKELLSQDWILNATSLHSVTPESSGDFNYGYHIWTARDDTDFLFNGMLGQNVWVSNEFGTVCVLQCGNNELFSQSPALSIVRRVLSDPDTYVPDFVSDASLLPQKENSFFVRRSWILPLNMKHSSLTDAMVARSVHRPERWQQIFGTFALRDNNVGILPFFLRTMQNNYNGGIRAVTLQPEGNCVRFISHEGNGDLSLRVGLGRYEDNFLSVGGEEYLVRAIGEAAQDEDRRPVWKIELCFPEMPNVRRFKFTYNEEGLLWIRFIELPDDRVAGAWLNSARNKGGLTTFLYDLMDLKSENSLVRRKLHEAFAPEFNAVSRQSEDFASLLERENALRAAERKSNGFLVNQLTRIMEEGEGKPDGQGFRPFNFLGLF